MLGAISRELEDDEFLRLRELLGDCLSLLEDPFEDWLRLQLLPLMLILTLSE